MPPFPSRLSNSSSGQWLPAFSAAYSIPEPAMQENLALFKKTFSFLLSSYQPEGSGEDYSQSYDEYYFFRSVVNHEEDVRWE